MDLGNSDKTESSKTSLLISKKELSKDNKSWIFMSDIKENKTKIENE